MTEEVYLSIEEVKKTGLLQEANRLFFNPLGLVLEAPFITYETGEKEYKPLRIRDVRNDDPAGLIHPDVGEDHVKRANNVAYLRETVGVKRKEKYGFVVQPLEAQAPVKKVAAVEVSMS